MTKLLLIKILIVVTAIAIIAGTIYYKIEAEHAAMTRPMRPDEKRAIEGVKGMQKALKDYQPK